MPRVEEIVEAVGKARFISTMNLAKGYYQILIEPKDQEKTVFVCHAGYYQFTRMHFGVWNAPSLFQKLMDKILKDVQGYSRAYMDDIVVFSSSWEEHISHVRSVLGLLGEAGLTVNPEKCRWGSTKLKFFGHIVGNGSLAMPEERASAIRNYVKPKTKRGLRAFLGLVSYYRHFIERLAEQTATLTTATSKLAPPRVVWTECMEVAFFTICEFLSNQCVLTIPVPSDSFSVVLDASALGLGGVLQVLRGDKWKPVAYHSRQTRGAERNYSASELEALSLVMMVHHFSYYLYGLLFKAFTDHRALCSLLTSETDNGHLRRLAMKLQPWQITICYLPGADNGLANALSRQEWLIGGVPDKVKDGSSLRHVMVDKGSALVWHWGVWGANPHRRRKEEEEREKDRVKT